jgi:hypothetical protein
MLKLIHFLVSRSLKGACAGIDQQRQRLDLGDSIARPIAVRAAIPRVAKFVTASAGILLP